MIKKYTFYLAEVRGDEEEEMEIEIPDGATEEDVEKILEKELHDWVLENINAWWEEAKE